MRNRNEIEGNQCEHDGEDRQWLESRGINFQGHDDDNDMGGVQHQYDYVPSWSTVQPGNAASTLLIQLSNIRAMQLSWVMQPMDIGAM